MADKGSGKRKTGLAEASPHYHGYRERLRALPRGGVGGGPLDQITNVVMEEATGPADRSREN
jgi:hypothetical protein